MEIVIVDSSVWVSYFRGLETPSVTVLRKLLATTRPVYLTDIVYAELRAGSFSDDDARLIERLHRSGRIIQLESIDDFERAAACSHAARRTGRAVRSITDCLIASVCIREDAMLLHDDRDLHTLAECTDLRELVP
jgi:predicted nucleic acid-binding protein